jgi:hypothetical protein
MGCKVAYGLSIFSLPLGESLNSGCHIVRVVNVFAPCSIQFVEDGSPLGRAESCNEAYAIFGAFIYPVGEVAHPAAPRAWAHCGPAHVDARPRAHCDRVRTPKEPAAIAHGGEQVSVACHCGGKLAPAGTSVAGPGPATVPTPHLPLVPLWFGKTASGSPAIKAVRSSAQLDKGRP